MLVLHNEDSKANVKWNGIIFVRKKTNATRFNGDRKENKPERE